MLTALVLYVDGRRYEFHGPLQILKTDSEFDRQHWAFSADNGSARLTGEARAPGEPDKIALVRYTDTDGSDVWCYNSKLCALNLTLTDHERGIERVLHSTKRAAYETVTREQPTEKAII